MLEKYLALLKEELLLESSFTKEKNGGYHILFDPDLEVVLDEKEKHIFFKGVIASIPSSEADLWFIKTLEANLFGMGTRGAVIGLDGEDKFLTLSHQIPSSMSYDEFKEVLQDFVSVLAFWREKVLVAK